MNTTRWTTCRLRMICLLMSSSLLNGYCLGEESADIVKEILRGTNVRGGLIVQIGCGDGKLMAALGAEDGYVVHGVDSDMDNVIAAREFLRSMGVYGRLSANTFDGKNLPYADGLVNLLVAEDLGEVGMDEVMRVLAPGGVACIRDGDGLTKTVKSWPREIDQWTHAWYDASGNAVAKDSVVGPIEHLQWMAGPLWQRSHGWTPSVSAMVSAGGRVFYVIDETPTGVDGSVPDRWFLVARDAFNGMLLWKVPIDRWNAAHFGGTTALRWSMPPHIHKRLVATEDSVFFTMGADAPVSALDAATGRVRKVYRGTERTDIILKLDGRLVLSRGLESPAAVRRGKSPRKTICVVDVESGKVLWQKGEHAPIEAKPEMPYGRLEMIAGDGQVFALCEDALFSYDLESGEELWRVDRPALPEGVWREFGLFNMMDSELCTMIYADGRLLLAQPEPEIKITWHTCPGTLYAFDVKTGQLDWKQRYGGWGHLTPPDVFRIGDLVWVHEHVPAKLSYMPYGTTTVNRFEVEYAAIGLDPETGEVKRRLSTREIFPHSTHHHRCWRNRSTTRFLMTGWRGPEFIDLASGEISRHNWTRGACLYGMMPCNGLLYVPPHFCACYWHEKMRGFLAYGSASEDACSDVAHPLERGPAFGKNDASVRRASLTGAATDAAWPTYRHDPQRSGATPTQVSVKLKKLWATETKGRPGPLVVAERKTFTTTPDSHAVLAFDATTGEPSWSFIAGARVDTPPTIHQGLALFGANDGWVYAVAASDGRLAWRLRAAPRERLVGVHSQLESAWPVPGAVLIHDDLAWVAAGRSSYLDGGIRVLAIEPATGKLVHEIVLDSQANPSEPGDPLGRGNLGDILSSDGTGVCLRHERVFQNSEPAMFRVLSSSAYTDASWFNRNEWIAGKARTSGLMVMNGDSAYGTEVYRSISREDVYAVGQRAYRLTAFRLNGDPAKNQQNLAQKTRSRMGVKKVPQRWQIRPPIRISAMTVAGDTLFIAGPPDTVDSENPLAAFDGQAGGILWALSTTDGSRLAEYRLDAPPVWDGMIAACGRLYISVTDGHVLCMGPK